MSCLGYKHKTFKQLMEENNIKTLEDAVKCDELWSAGSRIRCRMCHRNF